MSQDTRPGGPFGGQPAHRYHTDYVSGQRTGAGTPESRRTVRDTHDLVSGALSDQRQIVSVKRAKCWLCASAVPKEAESAPSSFPHGDSDEPRGLCATWCHPGTQHRGAAFCAMLGVTLT